jgi:hypothetical protein
LVRTTDSTWVKVKAGSTEGWVPAQVSVVLPANENGVTTTPFCSSVAISSLAVVNSAPAPVDPAGPRVSLNTTSRHPGRSMKNCRHAMRLKLTSD